MILITGASSGIGEATAERFARDARPLILWGRRRERLEAVRKKCLSLGAKSVHLADFDVRDRVAMLAEVEENRPLYEKVSVLLNNAGLAKGFSPFQDAKIEELDEMIDVNVKGFLNVTTTILPLLLKKNQGHMIHLGSVAGTIVYPKGHVYCASKAAIHALTTAFRMDLNGTAIRVTEIAPGMVETGFSVARFEDEAKAKAVYHGMTPLIAEDVADAIHWAATRPEHVNIQEIVMYPVAQASPTIVSRK